MSTKPMSSERRTPYWLWWLLVGFIGLAVWSVVDFNRRMTQHRAAMTRLGATGTAPGDAWLALLRSDPAAARAAATASFREKVTADQLAAWAKATPAVIDPAAKVELKSFGGGRVVQSWFVSADDAPPRLVLAGPGGLTLEFVEEGGAVKLDAVRVNGADSFGGN